MYNVKKLGARLKSKGLIVAEDAAEVILEETCEWLKEEALESKTPLDDILIVLLPVIKPIIDKQVDKIDGQVG